MSDDKDNEVLEEPRVLCWKGPEPLPEIPNKNFAVFMLEEMAEVTKARRDAVAMVDSETGQKRTYLELCELVPRVSAGLAEAGLGLGDRVMIYSLNHIDVPLAFLSVLHRGATAVMLSPVYEDSQESLVHGLRVSGARWAVVHSELLDQAEAAFLLLPPDTLKKVWVIGGVVDRPNIIDLADHRPLPPVTQADGLDPATAVGHMPFSSGTTGRRKGVMISHRSGVSTMVIIKYLARLQLWLHMPEAYSCILTTWLSHMYAHIFLYGTLVLGGTAVIMPHFSLSIMLEKIQECQVTLAVLTPYHLKMIVDSPVAQQSDLSSLKAVTCAAGTLTASLVTTFQEKFSASVFNMWGMTEIGSVGTMCLVTPDYKDFCIGKTLPFLEFKVVDKNSGQMLAALQGGELCVRSPTTMYGYAHDDASAEIKDVEGWVHTGDYGYYDQDDVIYLTDRIKVLIKGKGGSNVLPSELEGLLLQHPHVTEAVVVGVLDEDMIEVPRAFVVLNHGAPVKPRLLQQFVNERVSDFKELTGGVWVVKEIPKNTIGKPLLQLLKEGAVSPLAVC